MVKLILSVKSLYRRFFRSSQTQPMDISTLCGGQKFKPLKARIKLSFISRETKELDIECSSILNVFLSVLLLTEHHGNITAEPVMLEVLCSSVHSVC